VLVLDEQDRVIYANSIFRRSANIWPETPVGKLIDDALEDWPNFAETFKNVDNAHTEVKITPDPSTALYFDLRIAPVYSGKNRPVGRIFVLHDISERKQAEMRLASPEDPLAIQPRDTSLPLVLIFQVKDGKIIEVNRAFVLALGHAREAVIGQTLVDLAIWTSAQRAQFMQQIRENVLLVDTPVQLTRKSGQPLNVTVTARQVDLKGEAFIIWMAYE